MRCSIAFTLLATLSAVVAAPIQQLASRYAPLAGATEQPTLAKRNCNPMPSKVDPKMRDIIYQVVRERTKDPKVLTITMCTAITESLVNNLDCGDQDSLGLFQQRPSKGWGTPAQLQDPRYSTNKFLDSLMPLYNKNPGLPPNVLAQQVQRAEAGDQYFRNIDFANQLIEQARKSVGDGGSSGPGSYTPPASSATKTSTGNNNGGAINVGSKPTSTSSSSAAQATPTDDGQDDDGCDESLAPCDQYYVPVAGDNCYKVASAFNLTLNQLYELNPDLDSVCSNLYRGKQYCVAASDV